MTVHQSPSGRPRLMWLARGDATTFSRRPTAVAASTIRHRLTALSTLYERLDGKEGVNPVKDVERPREPEPQPDARPVEMIQRVLDASGTAPQ